MKIQIYYPVDGSVNPFFNMEREYAYKGELHIPFWDMGHILNLIYESCQNDGDFQPFINLGIRFMSPGDIFSIDGDRFYAVGGGSSFIRMTKPSKIEKEGITRYSWDC